MHLQTSLPLSLLALLVLNLSPAAGLVTPEELHGRSIPLTRRTSPQKRSPSELGTWLQNHRANLEAKYGIKPSSSIAKRQGGSGLNLLTNQDSDTSYYGSIAVGTPLQGFDVILDTGSSDLWLATSSNTGRGVTLFDSSSSSTFVATNTSFSVQYASGSASGALGSDTVSFAGFEVQSQTFGLVDDTSSGLLTSPVSGLMGLAFSDLATSGATPFWETITNTNGALASPLFAVQLTRFNNASHPTTLEYGGVFTFGATNSSLFTGDIDFQDVPSGSPGYWMQEMTGLNVDGTSISLPSGSSSFAAIDTGTTGIGGPTSVLDELYAAIPGAAAGTGQFQGFYTYPCSTDVTVTFTFGGSSNSWTMSPADFKFEQVDNTNCIGSLFQVSSGSNTPAWIIGDSFLKNVYSVYRSSPRSVGFAALSSSALAENGVNAAAPSPTIASSSPSATGSGTSAPNSSDALSIRGASVLLASCFGVVVMTVMWML